MTDPRLPITPERPVAGRRPAEVLVAPSIDDPAGADINQIGAVRSLRSDLLAVEIWPERGARIASLRDLARGHEWMDRPPPAHPLIANWVGDDFRSSPLVGADECFPTVGAARIGASIIPDHGEVWPRAWVETEAGPGRFACACDLDCLPLMIERAATVDGASLRLDYRVENLADRAMPWLWAWHPLLVLPERPRLTFRGVGQRARVESMIGMPAALHAGLQAPISDHDAPLHWLDLGVTTPAAAKLFLTADPVGSVTLAAEERGASLTIAWAGDSITGLGIWINRGGWQGLSHVAIEPTTAPVESIADVDPRHWLAPRAFAAWSLTLTVSPSA